MLQDLAERLQKQFPDAILSVDLDESRGELSARVRASAILQVARYLHDAPDMAFDHITDICSADYPSHKTQVIGKKTVKFVAVFLQDTAYSNQNTFRKG